MPDEPTPAEVMREVQRLVRQVESLVKEVRSDYVRRELYDAKHTALTGRVETLEREADEREKSRQGFQRQVMAGALVGMLLLLANIAVDLMRIPGVGS